MINYSMEAQQLLCSIERAAAAFQMNTGKLPARLYLGTKKCRELAMFLNAGKLPHVQGRMWAGGMQVYEVYGDPEHIGVGV